MFDLRILVEDKKLHEVLWKLDGLIAQPPQIVPVRGAKVVKSPNGTTMVKSTVESGNTLTARFKTKVLDFAPQTELTMSGLKQMMVDLGGAPTSAYQCASNLVQIGVLKHAGKGQYIRTNH